MALTKQEKAQLKDFACCLLAAFVRGLAGEMMASGTDDPDDVDAAANDPDAPDEQIPGDSADQPEVPFGANGNSGRFVNTGYTHGGTPLVSDASGNLYKPDDPTTFYSRNDPGVKKA